MCGNDCHANFTFIFTVFHYNDMNVVKKCPENRMYVQNRVAALLGFIVYCISFNPIKLLQ